VLVAEDEPQVAQSISRALSQLGYERVGPAASGRRAVELARERRPDLALLDIRMPEMDGLEAGAVIWRELRIPVVFLSAFSGAEYLQQVMDLGAFGYLIKPATLDDLRVHLGVAWARYLDWLVAGDG
jgi:response regulator NasT